jgi:hypothetical protein
MSYLNSFKKYFFHDPFYVLYYVYAYIQKNFKLNIKFEIHADTVKEIQSGKSFIRFGDGEIHIINGGSIGYQKYDKELDSKLKKILKYFSPKSKYIVALPTPILFTNQELNKSENRLRLWLPVKIAFYRWCNENLSYADAHIFYFKNFFKDNIEDYLKNKKIIIHTNRENIKIQKNNLESRFSILGFVESLSENSFSQFIQDKDSVENIVKSYMRNGGSLDDIVLITAAGPMSKVLCFELSNHIQCIDIGKGIEQLYNDMDFEDIITKHMI